MTNVDFVARFAHLDHGNIVLTFSPEASVTLDGASDFTSLSGLSSTLVLL
jgi:hypothetical protein